MSEHPSVSELVLRWQEARQRGESVTAEALCASVPELLDAVRQRLAALQSMEALLGVSAGGQRPAEEPKTLAADSGSGDGTPLPPVAIPGYEVLGELGRGAFGVVYQARQLALKRLVALKMILSGSHAGADQLARFRVEAEAVARLQHPNIVQIYEVGEQEGRPFFSLEFVDGGTLDKKLARTPLPAREAAQLLEVLAQAMHAAHQCGIIHRDLKPANVLLTKAGQLKITDFGLAKQLDAAVGQTASGVIMGTPSYMAPEQALGESKKIGPAADVYALGAMLYEFLTGRPPFKGATPMDTLLQVTQDEPVPPSRLQPKVPRDLETICLKCLEKELAKRYGSAGELAEELGRFVRGEPVRARPVGRLERGWRWARRQPMVAGLAAAVLLVLLSGIGVSTYFAIDARTKADNADLARKDAVTQEGLAKGEAHKAELARTAAVKSEQQAQAHLYVNRLALAQSEIKDGDTAQARDVLDSCQWDRRGWEWWYLHRCTHQLLTLKDYGGTDYSVCFSPDGQRLASAGSNGLVKIWDGHSGKELLSLRDPTNTAVKSVCFSPDGQRLASASGFRTVKVWDAHSGQQQLTLQGHTGEVNSVCFSPDGQRLASASEDKTVKVWDAQNGKELLILQGHTESVWSVCFSPDGQRLASASEDKTVKVWDAHSGQPLLTLKGHQLPVLSVCFSPDGQRLASASGLANAVGGPGEISVWDTRSGQPLFTMQEGNNVNSVCFSPDGQRLASACSNRIVKICDAQSGQPLLTFKGQFSRSVCFSPDGQRLASANAENIVKVWDVRSGQQPLTLKGPQFWFNNVCFSPDGERLATTSDDRRVTVWDARSGQELFALEGNAVEVCFSPDGQRLATSGRPAKVWDARTGRLLLSLQGQPDGLRKICFSPDGQRLAGQGAKGIVKVFDGRDGQELLSFQAHTDSITSVRFSPDGQRLASAGFDGVAKVWDARSGQELLTLEGHTSNAVDSACFSPDGQRLASASGDSTVRVWDAHSGQELLTLQGHTDSVHSVCFSPDGRRLASASSDSTIKVWDARSGQELLTLKGVWSRSLCFSPDGQRLASASGNRTVKVWDGRSGLGLLSPQGDSRFVDSMCFSPDSQRLLGKGSRWDHRPRPPVRWDEIRTWNALTGALIEGGTDSPPTFGFPTEARSSDGKLIVRRSGNGLWVQRLSELAPEVLERQRREDFLTGLGWHKRQAAEAEQAKQWFAAAFHLKRLIAGEPEHAGAYRRRLACCEEALREPGPAK